MHELCYHRVKSKRQPTRFLTPFISPSASMSRVLAEAVFTVTAGRGRAAVPAGPANLGCCLQVEICILVCTNIGNVFAP